MAEPQLREVIAGRPGWHLVTDTEATYARPGAEWAGRVAKLGNLAPGVLRRWHAAVIVGDTVERACPAFNASEAVSWIERWA